MHGKAWGKLEEEPAAGLGYWEEADGHHLGPIRSQITIAIVVTTVTFMVIVLFRCG